MRIAYIGLRDLAGHKFNGMDLCREMRSRGIDARFYVLFKQSNEDWVEPICGPIGLFIIKVLHRIEYYTGLQNVLSPVLVFLLSFKHIRKCDVVHFQMVQSSYFSLGMIRYFAKHKTVFWTLHDPWPLTGHCVHPVTSKCERWRIGCGQCPNLKATFPVPFDATAIMHRLKRSAFTDIDINLVVASDFMADMVAQSMMFKRANVEKIPFGIDDSVFLRKEKVSIRKRLAIPLEDIVIFFRAASSEFKGIDCIRAALDRLDGNHKTLLTVNEKGLLENLQSKYRILEYGWVEDDELLSDLYSACDIFLMPSRAESFGMMAIEAMACRVPVIAFDNTALSETVNYGAAGVLVEDGDSIALAQEIERLSADFSVREALALKGYQHVMENYTISKYFEESYSCYVKCLVQ